MTGVHLLTHHIKGSSVTIFLKKGALGDRSKKGLTGCEIAQNLSNVNKLFEIFGAICKFDIFLRKGDIRTDNYLM